MQKELYGILVVCLMLTFPCESQHQNLKTINVDAINDISNEKIRSEKRVLMLKFSPSGEKIAIGGLDKKICAYNLVDGSLSWEMEGPEVEPNAATNLPSSQPILMSAQSKWVGGKVVLINWANGEGLGSLSPFDGGRGGIDFFGATQSIVAWSGPEGRVFAYNFSDSKMETQTGWQHHAGKAYSVAYGPYGNIYSSGKDGLVVKNKKDEAPEQVMKFDFPVIAMGVNPYIRGTEGNEIFVGAGDNQGNFRVKKMNTGQELISDQLEGDCRVVKFHTTDPSLVLVATRQNLYFYDLKEGKQLKNLPFDEFIWSMDVSMDGTKLAVGLDSGQVKLYQL